MSQPVIETLMTVLDEDRAIAVFEHRKAKRCKLTEHAAKLLAKQFALCPDPNAAADEMILRGWQGFKAEWLGNHRVGKRSHIDAARDFHGSAGIFGRVGNA